MSCSKPVPPFNFDVLYYLNRDQLERFSIVCRSLKNFIDRYFNSKPYRIFGQLLIDGSYALYHNDVHWHPNRDDYSVQQFLDGQEFNIDRAYYSFAEMRPYLGPTVRIKRTFIIIAGGSTFNPEHIDEMESITHLWRDGNIRIRKTSNDESPFGAEDFQSILNSPEILQCQTLHIDNAYFSFKDYKVLYTVKVFEIWYGFRDQEIDPNSWLQFLEQPYVKPIVLLRAVRREIINSMLDCISKAFFSAVSPNTFKLVFGRLDEELTEFRGTNNTTREILELKKGLPVKYQSVYLKQYNNYTLERSSI